MTVQTDAIRSNSTSGQIENLDGIVETTTTLESSGLANLPAIDGLTPEFARITFVQFEGMHVQYFEIAHVTAHTADSTTATIERGKEGTTALIWGQGIDWFHAITVADIETIISDLDSLHSSATGVVFHGTDGTVARPEEFAYVEWRGSAEPVNQLEDDIWIPDDLTAQHDHDGIHALDPHDNSQHVDPFQEKAGKDAAGGYAGLDSNAEVPYSRLPFDSGTFTKRRVEDVVANHGAVGDGSTDDSAAIQAAIDTGNSVLIPELDFRIDTGLVMSTDEQELVGLGGNSRILNHSTDPAIKLLGTASDRLRRCRIAYLEIEGNNTDSGDGVAVEHTTGSTLERVRAWRNAIGINFTTGAFTNNIIECEASENRLQGVRLGPQSNSTYAHGGRWSANGSQGMFFDNDGTESTTNAVTLIGVDIEGNDGHAIEAQLSPNGAAMRVYALGLFGCYFENNCQAVTGAQIELNSGSEGRQIVGCFFQGGGNATHPVRVRNDGTGVFAGNRSENHSTSDSINIVNSGQGWLVAEIGGRLTYNKVGDTYPNKTGELDFAQQTAPAALTDNSGGTTDDTVAAVSGSGDDATINDNFAELAQDIDQIRTALVNIGLIA